VARVARGIAAVSIGCVEAVASCRPRRRRQSRQQWHEDPDKLACHVKFLPDATAAISVL